MLFVLRIHIDFDISKWICLEYFDSIGCITAPTCVKCRNRSVSFVQCSLFNFIQAKYFAPPSALQFHPISWTNLFLSLIQSLNIPFTCVLTLFCICCEFPPYNENPRQDIVHRAALSMWHQSHSAIALGVRHHCVGIQCFKRNETPKASSSLHAIMISTASVVFMVSLLFHFARAFPSFELVPK